MRIASLVPSTTETVCRLGAGSSLVARTRYCVEPAGELAAVPALGGTKNPQLEAIAARRPDLVLGNAEENRAEDLAWLQARFEVLVQTPCSVTEARAAILALGARLDARERAAAIAATIDDALALVRAVDPDRARLRVFYAVWCKPWMGVGRGTYIDDVLRCAGFDNVTATRGGRYPEVAADDLATLADVVLLPDEPWDFTDELRRQLAATRTFGDARLVRCAGRDFCWHGAHAGPGLAAVVRLANDLAALGPAQ